MLQGYGPITQAALGTLFTWGMTAAGAALVAVFHGTQRKLLDASLGFAAGVMIAASYWSLLAPAIEMAEESQMYGESGQFAFLPVSIGFLFGAVFVYGTDVFISNLGINSPNLLLALQTDGKVLKNEMQIDSNGLHETSFSEATTIEGFSSENSYHPSSRKRVGGRRDSNTISPISSVDDDEKAVAQKGKQWKRILLLIVAITVHNIPEGLAVGVGFGACGKTPSATFESARNLAIGIGIQNFPEGLAVSLPLHAAGFSVWRSFWYGQLSGMVEPIFGILGAAAVSLAQPILPYALAFAAGAMIYVVVDDIIPEANMSGNGKLASWGAVWGFVIMMMLDVGLG